MAMNRRAFLRTSAAAGAWIAGVQRGYGQEKSANARLNVAVVGVAGMRGSAHLAGCASENIVALCDVDEGFLGKAAEKLPKASKWADFREMLDRDKSIDAVCVSTPDHLHAPIGVRAMRLGKHLYSEKPLAHSIHEARTMREVAAQAKVATQMGTQIHAGENYRRVVELIRAGAIGRIKEVHVYVGGAWTADGWPKDDPVPPGLSWDLWTGPAAERPFSKGFHPTGWRRYWNYGGGHLADMGCHHMDLPFWALGLKAPTTCTAEGPPVNAVGAPPWLKVTWEFADGLKLHWTHGDKKPEIFTQGRLKWGSGTCFVGEKGMLFADYGQHKLWPEESFVDFEAPKPSIAPSPGHHAEWIAACKGGPPALCNFEYAGALTECVLLGNVAYRAGKTIEWDSAGLKARNGPEADAFLRREYRKGWTL
jgi:predicted dehydrogenase